MGASDYNPLEYFKELTLFPRSVFLVGFVVFVVGITHGIYNKTAFAGIALIMFALSCQYFSDSRWQEPGEPYRMHFDSLAVVKAVLLLVVTTAIAFWAYHIPAHQQTLQAPQQQRQQLPQSATPSGKDASSPVAAPAKPIQSPKKPRGASNSAIGSVTQGSGSALSVNQQGGITAGTYNGRVPPKFELKTVSENIPANGVYETKFRLSVVTDEAFLLHLRANAPNIVDRVEIQNERPPEEGGEAFSGSVRGGSGYIEYDVNNIESGAYIITVKTSQPESVKLDYH